MSNSLHSEALQHARLPCPSLSPGVSSKVCPLSQWCHLIFCCTILYLSSIFPSIKVFSSKPALHIKSPKYWSFSFSISPSDAEYSGWMSIQGWCSVDLTGSISLQSKGVSRVFSGTTVWKHHLFGSQPYLWSNSHICILLLEKPQIWLSWSLAAKWCLCFLVWCQIWWENHIVCFKHCLSSSKV